MAARVIPADTVDIKLSTEITRDDIVSVAVCREEEKLNVRRKELDKERQVLSKEIEKAEAKLKRDYEREVKRTARGKITIARRLLRSLGITGKVEISAWEADDKGYTLSYYVNIGDSHRRYGSSSITSKEFKVSMTSAQVETLRELAKAGKDLSKLEERSIAIRRALAELPQYERKVKAKMAEAVLRSSRQGQRLLSTINSVKALGMG